MRTFFVAGIIQGSLADSIHPQDYRERLVGVLRAQFPGDEVYCPVEEYPSSLAFDEAKARRVFLGLMARAAEADVLVAYLPEASMGTAIEMWGAYHQDRVIVAISQMAANWAIRFLSTRVLPDLEAFEQFVRSGELDRLLASRGL